MIHVTARNDELLLFERREVLHEELLRATPLRRARGLTVRSVDC